MGFSRQEYWSGFPVPSPGDFSNPGIEPRCLALQADSLLTEPPTTSGYCVSGVLGIFSIMLTMYNNPAWSGIFRDSLSLLLCREELSAGVN